jgi:hypothetical protein
MDKVAAANRINEFLQAVVNQGGLHIKYRIVVDPPAISEWEKPEIFVDLSGRLRFCGCRRASMRSWRSIARISGPSGSRSCERRPALRRRKSGGPGRRFILRPCHPASGGWCTWRCAMKPIFVRRATARGATVAWCCILRIIRAVLDGARAANNCFDR